MTIDEFLVSVEQKLGTLASGTRVVFMSDGEKLVCALSRGRDVYHGTGNKGENAAQNALDTFEAALDPRIAEHEAEITRLRALKG